ncbi:MAG: phage tail terminator protein [Lysobacterales bacterium]
MNGPLDLKPWRERLIAEVPVLRSVGQAADLAAARAALRNTPQAFVMSVSDSPVSRAGAGNSVIAQNINATVAVVLLVSNQRAALEGSAAAEDLEAIRRQIWATLIGWIPPGGATAIQYSGGALVDFADSTVLHSDRFTTAYFVRKEIAA